MDYTKDEIHILEDVKFLVKYGLSLNWSKKKNTISSLSLTKNIYSLSIRFLNR